MLAKVNTATRLWGSPGSQLQAQPVPSEDIHHLHAAISALTDQILRKGEKALAWYDTRPILDLLGGWELQNPIQQRGNGRLRIRQHHAFGY
jgi:hypothetical protein